LRYKIKSPDDKGLRIIIIREIGDGKHPVEILYKHGFKAVFYAAKSIVSTKEATKGSYEIGRAIKVLEQCEITYPIDKYPEKYI